MRYLLILSIMIFGLFSCDQHPPLETVEQVELDKYAGLWYEIASFPQRFQRGCTCTTAKYTPKDGYIEVLNRCYRKDKNEWSSIKGKAFVTDTETNSKLKVQFFWPFRGKYWIIELAEDYSYVVVGHPNRDYLWILSRNQTMDETLYKQILDRTEKKGFDISRLQRTEHQCEEPPQNI